MNFRIVVPFSFLWMSYQKSENHQNLLDACTGTPTVSDGITYVKKSQIKKNEAVFSKLFDERIQLDKDIASNIIITTIALTALGFYASWSLAGLAMYKLLKPISQTDPLILQIANAALVILALRYRKSVNRINGPISYNKVQRGNISPVFVNNDQDISWK